MLIPFPGLEDVRVHFEVEFRPWEWAMDAEPNVIEIRVAEVRFVVWPGTNHAVPLCSIPDAPNFGQAVLQYARLRPWRLQDPNARRNQNNSEDGARSALVVGPDGEEPRTLEEVVKSSFQIVPTDFTIEETEQWHMCNLWWIHVIDLPELADGSQTILTIKYEAVDDGEGISYPFILCTWCSHNEISDVDFVSPWHKHLDDRFKYDDFYNLRGAIKRPLEAGGRFQSLPRSKDDYEMWRAWGRNEDIPKNVQLMPDELLADWKIPDSPTRYAWECACLHGKDRLRYATGYHGDFGELQRVMELVSRLAVFYYHDAYCFKDFKWHFTCVAPYAEAHRYRFRTQEDIIESGLEFDYSWKWTPAAKYCLPLVNGEKWRNEKFRERWGSIWNQYWADMCPVETDLEHNYWALNWIDLWNDFLHSYFVPRCWTSSLNRHEADPCWLSNTIGYTDQVGNLGFVDFSKVQTRLISPYRLSPILKSSGWLEPIEAESASRYASMSAHEKVEILHQVLDAHHELRAWLKGKASSEKIEWLLCKDRRWQWADRLSRDSVSFDKPQAEWGWSQMSSDDPNIELALQIMRHTL